MEINELADRFEKKLAAHEYNSACRADQIKAEFNRLLDEGKSTMETPQIKNIFTPPAATAVMGNDGFGGGNGIYGLAALALLNGGLNRNQGVADAAVLNVGLDGVNHNINNASLGINHNINSSLMGITTQLNNGFGAQRDITTTAKLGDIEGAIWQAEGQAQLAIAQSQSELSSRIADGLMTAIQGQGLINQNIANANAANLIGQGDIRATILAAQAAGVAATKDAQYATAIAIRDDGDKTRAQITLYNEANLQRQLGVAEAALLARNTTGAIRESEINITNNNSAVAQQSQLQAQQQQQLQLLVQQNAFLSNLAGDIQAVRQTQSNVNFGVQGNAAQTASAANNKVN